MKRFFTVAFFTLTIVLVFGQGSPRKVLWEQFTNTSCGPCAGFNPQAEAYWAENEDIVVPIAFHVWWPGANDPMYQNNTAEQQWRTNYYGCNSVPWTTINGNKFNANPNMGSIQNAINSEVAIPSPFSIDLSHEKSGDQVTVTMVITCTDDITADMVAHIAIIEKTIEFANPPGSNGETVFHQVFKKFLPDNNGNALPASMSNGESVTFEETWTITGFYDELMLGVVGFIQNTSDKYIYQAEYSAPIGPDVIDAYAKEIVEPQELSCGNTVSPVIKVQNSGGIELTSFDVEYSVNGGDVHVYNWTGSIQFLSNALIDLPEISANINPTDNVIDVSITNTNGEDDSNPDNNSMSKNFDSPQTGEEVVMESYLGNQYAEELSWALYDPNGNIIAEASYTSGNNSQTIEETFTLTETGCYSLVWSDSYGDGFNGGGWCKLYADGELFASFNSFTSEYTVPWFAQIGEPLMPPVDPIATITDYDILFEWTAPSKATLLGYNIYEESDLENPINEELIEEETYTYAVSENGEYAFYFTAVYEEGESEMVGPVQASITVGLNEIANNNIAIYPNPVNDYLNIASSDATNININIYSVSGKLVYNSYEENTSLVKINTTDLENGIYFVEIIINEEKSIQKVSVLN